MIECCFDRLDDHFKEEMFMFIKKLTKVISLIVKSMAAAGELESKAYYIASKGHESLRRQK